VAQASDSLADLLERILDKGVVIVGEVGVSVVDVELLTLRIRLFIASAQTAKEMGMDWWTNDPYFAPNAAKKELDNTRLRARIAELETALAERAGKEIPR
jgi:hypothetical protein